MNDEIKEILEDIKEIYYFKPLLDYITNLQGELEGIKDNFKIQLEYDEELENKITNLQEEIERLKKRNKEIYDGFIATQEELSDYATRNEKAIEYIEERKNLNWYADGVFVYELLNILNGGDEE